MLRHLGKHSEDEYQMYAMKYKQSKSMGKHDDYGGSKSEEGVRMRVSLGIGSPRTISFSAKSIDPKGYSDQTGKVVKGSSFKLLMDGNKNGYMMSPFASGMTGLCFSDPSRMSVIRAELQVKSMGGDEIACAFIITFSLRKIELLPTALAKFCSYIIDI